MDKCGRVMSISLRREKNNKTTRKCSSTQRICIHSHGTHRIQGQMTCHHHHPFLTLRNKRHSHLRVSKRQLGYFVWPVGLAPSHFCFRVRHSKHSQSTLSSMQRRRGGNGPIGGGGRVEHPLLLVVFRCHASSLSSQQNRET